VDSSCAGSDRDDQPSIFAAARSSWAEAEATGPVGVLVIDHVERPTED